MLFGQIYYEKDDQRVSADEQRMSLNMHDNSLTISGTIVRDTGVYTCVITNGLDEARAYAFLTVKGNDGSAKNSIFRMIYAPITISVLSQGDFCMDAVGYKAPPMGTGQST